MMLKLDNLDIEITPTSGMMVQCCVYKNDLYDFVSSDEMHGRDVYNWLLHLSRDMEAKKRD